MILFLHLLDQHHQHQLQRRHGQFVTELARIARWPLLAHFHHTPESKRQLSPTQGHSRQTGRLTSDAIVVVVFNLHSTRSKTQKREIGKNTLQLVVLFMERTRGADGGHRSALCVCACVLSTAAALSYCFVVLKSNLAHGVNSAKKIPIQSSVCWIFAYRRVVTMRQDK